MNKTLTLIALAALAVSVAPTASACQYQGAAAETVNYLLPCSGGFGVDDDAESVVGFALEEADRTVAFVVELVTGIPLP